VGGQEGRVDSRGEEEEEEVYSKLGVEEEEGFIDNHI